MKKFTFIIVLVFNSFILFAQQHNHSSCGTEITPEAMQNFYKIKGEIEKLESEFLAKSNARRASTLPTSIPIKAHIIRNTDGSGGLSESDLMDALDIVNNFYANAGLNFFLCEGINYIDNTNLYNFSSAEEVSMTSAHGVDNAVNIYFANSVTSNGNSVCGYAYLPFGNNPRETIMMVNSCTTNGATLTHEIGHFFGLLHTHGPSNTTLTDELVDGSNCSSSGDLVCDTPADPQLSNSNVTNDCTYIPLIRDANKELFAPNPRNIMSYSRSSCRTELSPQQYARVNAFSQTGRGNLECFTYNADFIADKTLSCDNTLTVNFTDNSKGATSWAWDVDGDNVTDYTTQNVTHTYTSAAEYDVALSISDGTTTINKVKSNFIDVGADDINTQQIELTLNLDGTPGETSWTFSDGDGNVLYSGSNYNGFTQANQTINETFDVDLNKCYIFIINDSAGNGLDSAGYTLTTDDNTVIASGASFGSQDSGQFFNTTALSTDEFNLNKITLYPNPSSSELQLQVVNSFMPDRYEIYNTIGQRIKSKAILSDNDLNVNIKSLKNGVYFIKVKKDNAQVVYTFIKN